MLVAVVFTLLIEPPVKFTFVIEAATVPIVSEPPRSVATVPISAASAATDVTWDEMLLTPVTAEEMAFTPVTSDEMLLTPVTAAFIPATVVTFAWMPDTVVMSPLMPFSVVISLFRPASVFTLPIFELTTPISVASAATAVTSDAIPATVPTLLVGLIWPATVFTSAMFEAIVPTSPVVA